MCSTTFAASLTSDLWVEVSSFVWIPPRLLSYMSTRRPPSFSTTFCVNQILQLMDVQFRSLSKKLPTIFNKYIYIYIIALSIDIVRRQS